MKSLTLIALFCSLLQFQNASAGEVPRFKKLIWVWLENTSYNSMMNQKYIRNIWLNYPSVRFTKMKQISPIAQANVVAMISGNDFGIRDNELMRMFAPTIVNLMESKGITWKVYAEQYPGSCYLNEGIGDYKRYRVPFLSVSQIQSDRQLCSKIVNFRFLEEDTKYNAFPDVSIVIPSQRGSGATSSVATASATIQKVIEPIISNPEILQETTIILSTTTNNDIKNPDLFSMIIGNGIKDYAMTSNLEMNHYHLLRTLELGFDMGHLDQNDVKVEPISGIWK
jgi:hypothetical protein